MIISVLIPKVYEADSTGLKQARGLKRGLKKRTLHAFQELLSAKFSGINRAPCVIHTISIRPVFT